MRRHVLSNEEQSPAGAWAGLETVSMGDGEAVLQLPTRTEMTNYQGTVHGGVISLLADAAMGRAVASTLTDRSRQANFDLKVSFIGAARVGSMLRARAHMLHRGRRTGVAECRIEDDRGRLIATATATFSYRDAAEQRAE
ncbi:MAG: PaaI family thioesterase [Candidatus Dormibacteraeota bacterium]|nr:PaaI family thioesterase [Candidatus Dormibacteraeota bacterium]MBO0745614.1 PaaI family thioesterase [Candidatus Dormibacteraeota bacterium]